MSEISKRQPDLRLEKLLYRREEAAFVLGLSVREIDRLIAAQKMRTRRYGRCILIPADDVKQIATGILASDMLDGAETKTSRREER